MLKIKKLIPAILLLLLALVSALFFVLPDAFLADVMPLSISHAEETNKQSQPQFSKNYSNKKNGLAKKTTFIEPYVVNGFDWSLPKSTSIVDYSGFIDESDEMPPPYVSTLFKILRWDVMNPAKNKYDFSTLEQALKEAGGRKFLIRLEVNSACEAPKWALKQLRSSKRKSLIFWDQSYLDLLKPLITQFAKKYASNPQIAGVQLGIGDGEYNGACGDFSSKDGWGEFWMTPEELAESEDEFGLNANLFYQKTRQIIDLYANSFGAHKGKLAFTNSDPYFSWDDRAEKYNRLMPKIANYVLQKGLGNRDGEVEVWMRYLYPSNGVYFKKQGDNTCSLEMDEHFVQKIKRRYWGTENEFYGTEDYILDYGGPRNKQAYRFMVSSLRALQMRRNFMTLHSSGMKSLHNPIYKPQQFLSYLQHTMGKQISNTPDAFILLGERYVRDDRVLGYSKSAEACVQNGMVSVRSFGRWLSEKSHSTAAIKVPLLEKEKFLSQGAYLPDNKHYEYMGRSAKEFIFKLDEALIKARCPKKRCRVAIKVTYKDTQSSAMQISLNNNKTNSLKTKGDGVIKTATFTTKSLFNANQSGGDFVLAMDKALPVIMLRLVFIDK